MANKTFCIRILIDSGIKIVAENKEEADKKILNLSVKEIMKTS